MPKQDRAKETMQLFLEAAFQLLLTHEYSQISTNRIAKKAELSIGTLYQYFPNKESLLVALIEQQIQRDYDQIKTIVDSQTLNTVEEIVLNLIRVLLKMFSDQTRLRLIMNEQTKALQIAEPMKSFQRSIHRLLFECYHRYKADRYRSLSEISIYTITSAVTGAITCAARDAPDLLVSQRFEENLVRMVNQFISASA